MHRDYKQNKQCYTLKKENISFFIELKKISISEDPAAIVPLAIPYIINHHSNDHEVHLNLSISCINRY